MAPNVAVPMPPSVKPPSLQREVACADRQRHGGRDEIAGAREVDVVLDPDAPAGGGDQAENDDRRGRRAPAPGIVMISAPNLGEKPSTIATQAATTNSSVE